MAISLRKRQDHHQRHRRGRGARSRRKANGNIVSRVPLSGFIGSREATGKLVVSTIDQRLQRHSAQRRKDIRTDFRELEKGS
eukprot:scaffold40009_cov35-Attheya_sp.AAC.1